MGFWCFFRKAPENLDMKSWDLFKIFKTNKRRRKTLLVWSHFITSDQTWLILKLWFKCCRALINSEGIHSGWIQLFLVVSSLKICLQRFLVLCCTVRFYTFPAVIAAHTNPTRGKMGKQAFNECMETYNIHV